MPRRMGLSIQGRSLTLTKTLQEKLDAVAKELQPILDELLNEIEGN